MPLVLGTSASRASTFGIQQQKHDTLLRTNSVPSERTQVRRDDVRSDPSESDCKGHRLRGIDTGPCRSKPVNYTAILVIICVLAALGFAGFWKWKHSWAKDAVHKRTPRPLIARAVTDLSEQHVQLAEHLSILQQSALEQQRARDYEVSVDTSILRTPDVAHLRDRERHWEQYQIRSNQDTGADLEPAGSILHGIPSDEEENRRGSILRTYPSVETLPAYAVEDPLRRKGRVPAYTP
ncbi:MAG: hypothetical protein L6R40_007919 [Gallowayella cf. fulva]|nr:MAG: hypothetical protein L6R40_007919 [Xanthomendoza cf. fulva]